MRIASLRYRLPPHRLSNDEVIALVRQARSDLPKSALDHLEERIRIGFRLSGSEYRYLHLGPVDAMAELTAVASDALDAAGVPAEDLDLIIYVGVGRGVLEPAMTALLHKRLGATRAASFDILDACTSWVRGLEVAQALIQSAGLRNVLLVNCEMGMQEFAATAELTAENLDLYFSTLTVGEATTACVLQAGGGSFEFYNRTFPEGFAECMLPLTNSARFVSRELPADAIPNRFMARSTALVRVGLDGLETVWKDTGHDRRPAPDITMVHSVSARASRDLLRRLGLDWARHFDIHASHGNTVSASLPLALCLATETGRIAEGADTVLFGAGAGVSVNICRFRFEPF